MSSSSLSAREKQFSFMCKACSRCCKEKIIRVNPYEMARLASLLQISTSDFVRSYTWAGGSILRMPYHGNCVFRNSEGCSVHEARPLVCRLYPLRRITSEDGSEDFDLLDFEYRCTALAGNQGTVGEYLLDQKALEYLDMVDEYVKLVDRMADELGRQIGGDASLARETALICVAPAVNDPGPLPRWLDMDPVVSAYCAHTGMIKPRDVEKKARMHVNAIESWLGELAGGAEPQLHLCGSDGSPSPGGSWETGSSDRLTCVKTLARTLSILGYSIGVNLEELCRERFGTSDSVIGAA